LNADFDLTRFRHHAFFNETAGRVEMHLEATIAHEVDVGGTRIAFSRGETIWTESSYKYDRDQLATVTNAAGFTIERLWTDADDRFWVALLGA
jgi:uncharacterized SAM-dependent methyltransferase